MIITIDGPAGTGKSTVARILAEKLGFIYFDTGAMYRAATWFVLEKGLSITEEKKIVHLLKNFPFRIISDNKGNKRYFLEEKEITKKIRTQKITQAVSTIAAFPFVRKTLLPMQRKFAEKKDVVFEGRDMGTVVFPESEMKIFLDASLKIRATRRFKEMKKKFPSLSKKMSLEEILQDIQKRDEIDSSRKVSPLFCPKEAIKIDTSTLSVKQVIKTLLLLPKIKKKRKEKKERDKKCFPMPNIFHMGFYYGIIIFFSYLLFKIFYRHKIYGKERIPKKGAIIVANHVSFFDPPAISVSFPYEVHFLARETLFTNFFGKIISALNTYPIGGKSSDLSTFKKVKDLMKKNQKIILFPEGTRSYSGTIEKILPGVGFLAKLTKAMIVPVYIQGTYEVWNRKRKWPHLWGKRTACVFGTPFSADEFNALPKKEAIEAICKKIKQSLLSLKKWCEEDYVGTPP